MRRALYLVTLCIVATLVLAPAALAQSGTPEDSRGAGLETQGAGAKVQPVEAEEQGTEIEGVEVGGPPGSPLACVDFFEGNPKAAQAKAKAFAKDNPGKAKGLDKKILKLDKNNNGKVCESKGSVVEDGIRFEDGSGAVASTADDIPPSSDVIPAQAVASQEQLPDTGGLSILLVCVVAFITAAITVVTVARRRTP